MVDSTKEFPHCVPESSTSSKHIRSVSRCKAWKTMKWTGSSAIIKYLLTRHIVLDSSCQIEHQHAYHLITMNMEICLVPLPFT